MPGQWSQHAWVWFQRSELQLSALCYRASRQNQTIKYESETPVPFGCFFFFLNYTKGEEERKACSFDIDSTVWLQKEDKRLENFSVTFLSVHLTIVMTSLPTHIHESVRLEQTVSVFTYKL